VLIVVVVAVVVVIFVCVVSVVVGVCVVVVVLWHGISVQCVQPSLQIHTCGQPLSSSIVIWESGG
jgi:hypothetical protein